MLCIFYNRIDWKCSTIAAGCGGGGGGGCPCFAASKANTVEMNLI